MAGGEMIAESPTSTMMQGQFSETYATTPTGKRVVYNDKGEVQYIRNEDGSLYEGFEAETIIDSAKDVKKENGYNPFSLVGQFIDVAAYMVPTIAMSAATSGVGAAAGMGATGVNAMSKLGMFMGGYAQGYSSAKEEALKQRGLGSDEAEAFAVMSGLGAGVIENFNPIEGKIFSKSLSKNVIKENLVNLAAGRVTPYNVFENYVVNMAKGGFKESVLEEVPQAFFETGMKNYYNEKKGSEFQSDISKDQWIDILVTSFGMGAVADGVRSGKGSDLGKAALKTIVTNRDLYESYLTGMEKTSPEMAAKLRSDIDPLLTEIDAIDGLTPERKEKSVELLYDIRTVESKLASITEPTLRKPYEEKLVELRKELGKTVQVPTDAEGEPLEGEELQAVKQAAAQREKDKEKQKIQDSVIQEQEAAKVSVQSEATGSGTDTQGQSQPKSEGTTQQGQTQEQVQEELKTAVGDMQTTEQGIPITQGEKVAPTPQASAQTETQQPTEIKPITKADTKLKKGADFSSDGTYEVTHNGEVIGKMYYDRERKLWSDPEYVPKDAYDIYGNNLGTKEEAIQAMVDRYNSKQTAAKEDKAPIQETLEQAVQRVDSTSIIQLDDIISRAQKDLEATTDPVKKEDIQQTINSLTKTRDQLSNSQTNNQTKDENKESSQSNGQRQDEKRGQGQENEVRGQGQEITNQQTEEKLASDESKSKSNENNKEQGQEGQREGQVGSTLAEEQGEGKGEEVDTLNKSIQAVIGKGTKGLSVDPKALLDYIEQNKIGKKKC